MTMKKCMRPLYRDPELRRGVDILLHMLRNKVEVETWVIKVKQVRLSVIHTDPLHKLEFMPLPSRKHQ